MSLGQQTPKLIPNTAYALSKNGKTSSVLGDKLGQRQPYNRPKVGSLIKLGQRQPYNRPKVGFLIKLGPGNLTIAPRLAPSQSQVPATSQSPQVGCPIKPQVKTKYNSPGRAKKILIGQKVRHSSATSGQRQQRQ